MSSDESLQQELWSGLIPIVILLHEGDLCSLSPPEPLYLMSLRIGYLTQHIDDIVEHFRDFVPLVRVPDVWFEDSNGKPLNW